jgi:hypothetical protein
MVQANEKNRTRGVRKVLSTKDEIRAAIVEITGLANRGLAIFTPDLEPELYDHDDFLETLKKFVLARSFARVRVLVSDPSRTLKSGNRFVDMGRRLNSYIEFRSVKPEYRDHAEAYCISDDLAIVYRARADSWDGMSDTYEPAVARKYLDIFDELWQACEVETDLHQHSG